MMLKSFLVLCLLVASGHSQNYQQQQEGGQQQEEAQENEGSLGGGNTLDPSVPEPPSQIPETSFVCEGKPYDPGMYADEETGCRVFHMCYMGRKESFICGTGTVFNQEILSCDYPDNVDCAASSSFYSANSELGKSSPEPSGGGGQAARPSQGQRPTQQQEPDYEEPQYAAPRPAAPRQRPAAPPAARPPPDYRPAAGGSRPAVAQRPVQRPKTAPRPQRPSAPAPARTPSKARPAAQRPLQQINDAPLDYEPSQVVQRRVARHNNANSQVSSFQRRSGAARNQRWQLMSQEY